MKHETIAVALHARRERLGWTTDRAARYLGVAPPAYERYEKGLDLPEGRLVLPIACFLRECVHEVLAMIYGYESLVPVLLAMIEQRGPEGAHSYDLVRRGKPALRPRDVDGVMSAAVATGQAEERFDGMFGSWHVKKRSAAATPEKSSGSADVARDR
jgi:DNA-binding XRE family transcriptional regulator